MAFRLMQLPLGVFGVALGTVALPLLARMAATGNNMPASAASWRAACGSRSCMTIPASVGLMVLAAPIISVLYQHGRFGAHATAAEAAGALRFYAIGLCGYAALKVLVNAFYAIDRRKTPMVVSFIAVGLNLLLNWMFTCHLGWGHRGLAFSLPAWRRATSSSCTCSCARTWEGSNPARMLGLLAKVALACWCCCWLPGRADTAAGRLGGAVLLAQVMSLVLSSPVRRRVLPLCRRALASGSSATSTRAAPPQRGAVAKANRRPRRHPHAAARTATAPAAPRPGLEQWVTRRREARDIQED